jgi:hypothetical protein
LLNDFRAPGAPLALADIESYARMERIDLPALLAKLRVIETEWKQSHKAKAANG